MKKNNIKNHFSEKMKNKNVFLPYNFSKKLVNLNRDKIEISIEQFPIPISKVDSET